MNHAPQLECEVVVFDKNGQPRQRILNNEDIAFDYKILATISNNKGEVTREYELPFQSLVHNFVHVMNQNLLGVDNSTLIKTTASAGAPSAACTKMNILADAADDTFGIVVGLNDTTTGSISSISTLTASPEDWHVKHLIEHGTSTGQLSYGATAASTFQYSTGKLSFTRTFTNSSGGTITVKEIGVIANTNTTDNFLICRDVREKTSTSVNTVSIPILTGEALTVTYVFDNKSILQASASTLTRTLTDNYLAMLLSLTTEAATTVVRTTGLTSSIDFSANPTYMNLLADAGEETFGIVVGDDVTSGWVNSGSYNVKSPISESLLSYGACTALPLEFSGESVMNPRGASGSTPFPLTYTRIGIQRDFQNISVNSKLVTEIGLLSEGTSGLTYMIGKAFIPPTSLVVNPLETLRVTLRIAYMAYDLTGPTQISAVPEV